MKPKLLLLFFALGLLVSGLAAAFERAPGYMDAEYYYAGALRLAQGQGASEPYLWNYLNAPPDLPQPAFGYWMPLVSLLAAGGIKLLGWALPVWWAARLPFLLLAACLSPLSALLAYQLTQQADQARLAAVLALFPGFYLPYLAVTDAFALWMALGSLFLLLATMQNARLELRLLGLGLLAGLMHLSRADGILWLAAALLIAGYWIWRVWRSGRDIRKVALAVAALAGGYVLVMGAWFARNIQVWGTLIPPGSGRALWITDYGQTMIYPASLVNFTAWQAAGWGSHFAAWGQALSDNLQTWVAVQGSIILFPFTLAGMIRLRKHPLVRLAALLWLLTFGLMTLVFPLSGVNGAFFHSGAALQPFFWAVAPAGVMPLVAWIARLRKWQNLAEGLRFMSALLVCTVALLTAGLFYRKVVGSDLTAWQWERTSNHYRTVEQRLVGYGIKPGDRVLINDAPGYFLVTGREALVIPYGDARMLLAAAKQYHAGYLVLEVNNPPMLAPVYHRQIGLPELEYLGAEGDTQLYRIRDQGGAE